MTDPPKDTARPEAAAAALPSATLPGGGAAAAAPPPPAGVAPASRHNRLALLAFYVVVLAVFTRVFLLAGDPALRPWYLALQALSLGLFTLGWVRGLPSSACGVILVAQSAVVFAMLSLNPERDFVTSLFAVLSYQGASITGRRARWMWVGWFTLLTGGSLMFYLGPLRGLALALVPMAAGIVLPAFAVATEQLEAARGQSERMVAELEGTRRTLEAYAGQVEELAGMEERNRLARELHDSASQTMFSILLGTSSAQMLLAKDPAQVRPQLEHLHQLAHGALAHMRGLIADLDADAVAPGDPAPRHPARSGDRDYDPSAGS